MIAMAEVFEQHNFSNIDIVKYEEPMPEVVVELKADCILRGFRNIKVNTKITKKGKMFFTNLGNINYVDTLLIFSI